MARPNGPTTIVSNPTTTSPSDPMPNTHAPVCLPTSETSLPMGELDTRKTVRDHERIEPPAASINGTIGLNSGPSIHGASTKKKNHRCLPISTSQLSLPILQDEDRHKPPFTINGMALQKAKGRRRATDAKSCGKEREEEETERALEEAEEERRKVIKESVVCYRGEDE
ncbi:hypothetical protein M9H77_27953 [Catharanthus roseus]|uniref:Uncharacterized protein n=1 Tax=Catharanthus roseus TaxID=4058 RepID=A0ACC0AFM9_CATRO|nr:hypothetical protein M9H77_27953 [Catharanthus roseus]